MWGSVQNVTIRAVKAMVSRPQPHAPQPTAGKPMSSGAGLSPSRVPMPRAARTIATHSQPVLHLPPYPHLLQRNFGRPVEWALVREYPWSTPQLRKLDVPLDTAGKPWQQQQQY